MQSHKHHDFRCIRLLDLSTWIVNLDVAGHNVDGTGDVLTLTLVRARVFGRHPGYPQPRSATDRHIRKASHYCRIRRWIFNTI